MPTVKLIMEYDGTDYSGWQRQPDQRTVQEAIENAIEQLTQMKIAVVGAGRTDAGVHALGQVVSFRIDKDWTPYQWTRAMNARLPEDISVRSAAIMSDDFHARYAALGKLYEYRIVNRPERPAVQRRYVWHVPTPLNDDAMKSAAAALVGTHDFTSFEGTLTENEDPMCRLCQLSLSRDADTLHIQAYADRFLKHMVRTIVGTLVEIGRGKRSAEEMVAILGAKDRAKSGTNAPPHGLFLMRVDYDGDADGPPTDKS